MNSLNAGSKNSRLSPQKLCLPVSEVTFRLLGWAESPRIWQLNEGVDYIWVLEIGIIYLPKLEAWVGLPVVRKSAHFLRLLAHASTDGLNGDKDADFSVVLRHDLAESAHLRN